MPISDSNSDSTSSDESTDANARASGLHHFHPAYPSAPVIFVDRAGIARAAFLNRVLAAAGREGEIVYFVGSRAGSNDGSVRINNRWEHTAAPVWIHKSVHSATGEAGTWS